MEEIGQKMISNISVENVCRQHVAVGKLIGHVESENWNQVLTETLLHYCQCEINAFFWFTF